MPRLSMWRTNHSADYKFIDRRMSEMFTIGGTDIVIHLYLGTANSTNSNDATKPTYLNQSASNIQDLLFLENRDRIYDSSIYTLRGIYQKQDQDFDLTQFGIFLASGTQYMTFHLNDMVQLIGRKLMNGDVLELLHLKDYYSLDDSIPFAIKRYYVISDASNAAEGYSPTWWSHLWRVKMQPLVDSQEYKDIISKISSDSDPFSANANTNPLSSVISTYDKYLDINQSIIAQAEYDVPKSGYETANLYTISSTFGNLANPWGTNVVNGNILVSDTISVNVVATSDRINSNRLLVSNTVPIVLGSVITSANIDFANSVRVTQILGTTGIVISSNTTVANNEVLSFYYPLNFNLGDFDYTSPEDKIRGYMTGDGRAPNGHEVNTGIAFPVPASEGDYFLRLDFVPNRLFRYNGFKWIKIEDCVRTSLTPGSPLNQRLLSTFVNNDNTLTNSAGETIKERQSLSKILTPKADNT